MPQRVLLIDDDEIDRQAVHRALRRSKLDADVHTACDARSALESMRQTDFGCILLDYRLPDIDGLAFLRQLRDRDDTRSTPVIMLTGAGDERTAVAAIQAGAQDYLVKGGLTAEALFRSITTAIDRVRLELEREAAEEKLRRLSTLHQAIQDGANCAIVTTDESGIVRTVNSAAVQMLGRPADDLVGTASVVGFYCCVGSCTTCELGGDRSFRALARKCGDGKGREWTWRRGDGSRFPVLASLLRLSPGGACGNGYLCIAHDITDIKQAEKAKDEFVSMVSHELRTPVTSIMGSLGLLRTEALRSMPDKSELMLDIAYKNCVRLGRLIDDILDMEKIRSGHQQFDFAPTLLSSILKESIGADTPYADRHGVSFRLARVPAGVLVNVDAGRIAQVMSNLLSNAAKFSPPGGVVTVTARMAGNRVRISVRDRGPGIPAHLQGRIFEEFVQADSSVTRERGGTGLGLSIARAIVAAHGGTIGVRSVEGDGAEFHFDLPALGAPAAAVAEPVPALLSADRVLVCEDDPDIGVLLRMLLGQMGCHVEVCGLAVTAMERLCADRFALMTLDLGLPGKDGLTLLHEMRQMARTRELPVVVVSANALREKDRLCGRAVGPVEWLNKPIDPARLRAAVDRARAARGAGIAAG